MTDEGSPARRIRVLRIIDRLNIGGPARHVVWLTAGLDPARFETTLVTGTVPPGEGDMAYFAAAHGITPVVIPEMSRELGARDLSVLWTLLRLMWRVRPDVVHTHKSKAGAVGRTAAWIYRWTTPGILRLRPRPVRVVHTFHGHIFHSYYGAAKTRLFVAIERTLAQLCTDRIVTVSERQRDEIHGAFGVGRASQFAVIPLGLEVPHSLPAGTWRRELGVGPALLIGIVGRLSEVKNHVLALQTLAAIRRAGRDAHLAIVGDGHLRESLEREAARLGLTRHVTFAGFRQDVLALYPDFDLALITSRNEGTPLTLIEAMAAGRPVAATEVGGIPDIMGALHRQYAGYRVWDHGVTADAGDAAGLAAGIAALHDDPALRCTMGDRARAFVRARLSRARLVADVTRLYEELTGTAPAGGADAPERQTAGSVEERIPLA